MSNPTSNFNWQMPTNTDLVTDLPADFEVFGQAVDTSMADLKGGTTGQILSKATNADMDFTWITNDVGDITAVTATSPLTGGGTSGAITVGIQDATTSVKGSVQLSDSTSTTSSVLAATPTAVKSAYDLAASAYSAGFTNNFFAGKNKIINGDFGIWQRGTTLASFGYLADRFYGDTDATVTQSRQTFTAGTAPVAGYEGTYFYRMAKSAGGTYVSLQQKIEDVRTFAGQTITLSYWAKIGSGTLTVQTVTEQNFGSGGSASVYTYGNNQTFTTSWARYSTNITIPSIAGKTIGTSSFFNVFPFSSSTATAVTFDIWGVQIEAGSTATPFQTATGTKQGELAACQRYAVELNPEGTLYPVFGANGAVSTTQVYISARVSVTMRTAPTSVTVSGTASNYRLNSGAVQVNLTAISLDTNSTYVNAGSLLCTVASGLTANTSYSLQGNNSASAKILFSAEL